MLEIIGRRKFFLGFSALAVLLAVVSMLVFGFRLAVDFTGGSLWQLKIPGGSSSQVEEFFRNELKLRVAGIAFDSTTDSYAVTLGELSDAERQNYFTQIKNRFAGAEDLDFWRVTPSVSQELRQKSLRAIFFVLVAISFYVAFAFRKVSRPISSWKYGLITLLTLAHDVAIPAGVFALLGKLQGAAVDTNFVVALLVVMGFSVHDTIVVFDRIRENLTKSRNPSAELEKIINLSVNETLARSINTSLTLVLVLVALYLWGPVALRYFVLTILIGTVVGTYSSIFVASPLLVVLYRWRGGRSVSH